MNDELVKKIIEEQKLQTETIKELLALCTELVDRVKTLEEKCGIREAYEPVSAISNSY